MSLIKSLLPERIVDRVEYIRVPPTLHEAFALVEDALAAIKGRDAERAREVHYILNEARLLIGRN